MLAMTFNVSTNSYHVISNIASAHSQRYAINSVLLIGLNYIVCYDLNIKSHFSVVPNVISNAILKRVSIYQLGTLMIQVVIDTKF